MGIVKKYKLKLFFILAIVLLNCSKAAEPSNLPPGSFEIEVSDVLGASAKLVWTASIDPEESTVFYDIYLQGEKIADNITQLSFDLNSLEEGVAYLGKIVASDPEGNETTVPFNFETSINQPPTAFSVTVRTRNPLFSRVDWTESTDPEGEIIVYNVYLKGDLVAENVNSLYHFFADLKGLTSYSGYIEAIDPGGKTFKSNFSFITELKVYDRDLRLENQDQVEAFGKSCYNKIEGNLIIGSTNTNLTDVSNLSSLITMQTVQGDIYIQNTICKSLNGLESITDTTYYAKLTIDNNDELLSLQGLEGITSMHEIYIAGNKKLLNFEGLNNLTTVTNYMSFPYNESLESIEGLRELSVIKDLDIGNNDALANLKGLEKIENITTLAISGNDNLQSLEGLNNLVSCTSLSIADNNPLPNLKGLYSLKTVNGLYISGNPQLSNLTGLENLTKVTRAITVQHNDNLETLQGINNVVFNGGTSYGYSLGLHNNGRITNLDALSNYTFSDQKGSFSVSSNPELVDFCGLTQLTKELDITQINENVIFRWNKFNPSYNDMLIGNCAQ